MQTNFLIKMNEFSTQLYNQIIEVLPELGGFHKKESEFLEFHIGNEYKTKIGDLYIQTSAENEIWIKTSHPYTTYQVDSAEELLYILEGLFFNELFWVVSYEDQDWDDTFLVLKDQDIKTEEGITYQVLSWNGKNDKTIVG
ncbi:hypothetical protein GCM10010984_14810 [Chishuiella changwenlii]|uniref:Uncharacterized protein n=2 Tax=Chishuiella changwenlii TaxID=1434701 RepID=A0ABQ1TPZ8_9FLAO|nr:hypothetical protein GCM10010984_14810 [Chishuiella changwenlii]